ncbi:MAG TPA: hypothetical protein VE954_29865 [Oligoflexus sp.]|nr:hypothetical protein [Oligoflexus sp.]
MDRFYNADRQPITELAAMIQCEKELADTEVTEKTCRLYQTRSYELLNANANSIGVYRILKSGEFEQYTAQAFKRVGSK